MLQATTVKHSKIDLESISRNIIPKKKKKKNKKKKKIDTKYLQSCFSSKNTSYRQFG